MNHSFKMVSAARPSSAFYKDVLLRGFIVISTVLALIIPPIYLALAQTNHPPCSDEIYRQFDFWAGHWEVKLTDGTIAGENRITIEENGCLLVERWRSAKGGTGQSYNFVDNTDKNDPKWRQLWVSQGFTIDYQGGLNDKGEMALEGTITYRQGNSAPFRGLWAPKPDGTVSQFFEQYDDTHKTWKPWFLGIYHAKSTASQE